MKTSFLAWKDLKELIEGSDSGGFSWLDDSWLNDSHAFNRQNTYNILTVIRRGMYMF